MNKSNINYWFTVEPYVYIGLNSYSVLLYNTLDGATIESNEVEVIELLKEITKKENNGVVLLDSTKLGNKNIKSFVIQIRERFMGDIIDIGLSNAKPIQLHPFYNFRNVDISQIYKKHNFSTGSNIIEKLCEICIYIDHTTVFSELILFLQSIPIEGITINIIGNFKYLKKHLDLISFLNQISSHKILCCSYKQIIHLDLPLKNCFSYKILVDFPINRRIWDYHWEIINSQILPYEYVFAVKSTKDIEETNHFIEKFRINKYQIKPVYTGDNFHFFEEYVFITKEDIISMPQSINDIFTHQAMNIHDFGKINIMPNGDVYANLNHPKLGNISSNSINEIVYKEINEGLSWFRIRNQAPCDDCVYQWLCPSPSDYELELNRYNLCNIVK